MALILPSSSVTPLIAADERVMRRVPTKAEPHDKDCGLSREGPDVRAREIIFAESPVLYVYHRVLDSCGRRRFLARSYAIAYSIRRGTHIPQMG